VKRIEEIARKQAVASKEELSDPPHVGIESPVNQGMPGSESSRRLRPLYEISKLLIAFESVEHTVQAVLAVINQVVPLRSAILLERRDGRLQLIVWHAQRLERKDIDRATHHAISSYRYLVGGPPSSTAAEPEVIEAATDLFHVKSHLPTGDAEESPSRFIVLPLVVGREPIVGVLQVEGRDPVNETDLTFLNTSVNQLALALDRHDVHLKEIALREHAEELVKELNTFSYTVAHDLRAPLRAIGSFSHVLMEDFAGKVLDETGQHYVRDVAEAARRMDNFVLDLLDYTRLTRAEIPIERVDLRVTLSEVVKGMDRELVQRKALVTLEEPLPAVLGHRRTLEQVLTNVISNGAKFVASGVAPRLRARAEVHDGRVKLWIEDNGIGIAKEHWARIFGVFERLHKETEYPGTGIGLAIAKKGMERMGGRIGLESVVGKGSRFWIELPRGGP
jgi:signal transduction histidine kinase